MVSRGKSRKRRAAVMEEAVKNKKKLGLKSAVGFSAVGSSLPPTPSSKDLSALPSSLKRMMALKQAAERGKRWKPRKGVGNAGSTTADSKNILKRKAGEDEAGDGGEKRIRTDDGEGMDPTPFVLPKSKRSEKKKRYFEKKKQKEMEKKDDRLLHESNIRTKDVVHFGEVVDAPPKHLPKLKGKAGTTFDKATQRGQMHLSAKKSQPQPEPRPKQGGQVAAHHWPEAMGGSAASLERQRLEAVEGYRKKRGWTNRPGGTKAFPPMVGDEVL